MSHCEITTLEIIGMFAIGNTIANILTTIIMHFYKEYKRKRMAV